MKNSLGKSIYPFFETIRIVDGEIQLLAYHQRRIDHVFRYYYPRYRAIALRHVIPDLLDHADGIFKFRFEYNAVGYNYSILPYTLRPISKLVLTEATDIRYPFKFSDRKHINNLVSQLPSNTDVLISSQGRLRETSYANVIFELNNEWVTPLYPMFHGVMRSFLISTNKIRPMDLFDNDLEDCQRLKLINAMMPMESSITLSIDDIER